MKGLSALYLNQLIRTVAFSLVNIFIPIYLLTLGFSLNNVLIYLLISHLAVFIFTPLSLILSRRFGYKTLFIWSILLLIVFLILLQLIEIYNISLYAIALMSGLESAFYFMPLHAFFTRLSENEKRGAQFSNYLSIGQLAGLFGPLVGALIAIKFGFQQLIFVVIIFSVISIIPLFKLENIKPRFGINTKNVFRLIKNHKGFFVLTIFDNFRGEVEGIVWPIFVFLILKNLISVGWISFLVSIGAILFTLFVGRYYDKQSKYFFFRLGGLLYAVVWILRIFFDMPIFLYGLSLAAGFFALMINIPYNAIFYDKSAEAKDPDEFIVFVEIPNFIGRSFLWIMMILLAEKFLVAFILATIASLFYGFIRQQYLSK